MTLDPIVVGTVHTQTKRVLDLKTGRKISKFCGAF